MLFLIVGDICKDPKVDANSYTTVDGMIISDVACVAEFSVDCKANKVGLLLTESL